MTYEDYANVAAEMNILFRYIDDELVEKIPQKIIEFFQDIASPTFRSKIDPRFPLDEQYLLPSTECMLTLLYRQYWCSDEEREELDKLILEQEELSSQGTDSLNNIFDKIENSEDIFVEDTSIDSVESGKNLPALINKDAILEKLKAIRDFFIELFNNIFKKN